MKKEKRHFKIVLTAKTKRYAIEDLISKGLIKPYIKPDKFLLVSNVLREYN